MMKISQKIEEANINKLSLVFMEPESLFNLCLEASCSLEGKDYDKLPPIIRENILFKLTNRGSCSSNSLRVLIHRHLLKLDLSKCHITENDLAYIDDLNELKYLVLPQPPIITSTAYSEQALMKVIQNKSQLHTLGLSGHKGVTDTVINVVAQCAQNLQVLRLERTSITDNSLFYIRNLQYLTDLNIAHTQITDSGIEDFVSGDAIKSLTFISLKGCLLLSDISLKWMLVPHYRLCLFEEDLAPNMTVSQLDRLKNRRSFV